MDTAGNSRNPTRDRLLVLLAFRLALRVSELVDIRRQQIDLDTATIHIRRAKNGTPGIHGLQGDELRLFAGITPRASSCRLRVPVRTQGTRSEANRTAWRSC
jgi:integrase